MCAGSMTEKTGKQMNKQYNGSTTIANMAKHGYEATVKARALGTACVVAAPVAVAVGVGWAISKAWNTIWD